MTIYDHESDCNCDACTAHIKEQLKLAARRRAYAEKKKPKKHSTGTEFQEDHIR